MRYFSAIILLICICGCINKQYEEPVHPRQMTSTPIPTGKLGHPLGTYLTVEGKRFDGIKSGRSTLMVEKVNGRKLVKPVNIWVENVKHPGFPKNIHCVIRGYESGKMVGVPFAVAKKEKNITIPQTCWQFYRYFIMTSVVKPDSIKKQ